MSEHSQIRIHEAINAVLHARLLGPVEFARADFAGNALSEADVCQRVDCYRAMHVSCRVPLVCIALYREETALRLCSVLLRGGREERDWTGFDWIW